MISILSVLAILCLSTQGVPISTEAKRSVPKGPGWCRTVTSLEDPQHSFLCESHGGLTLLGGELTNCRCGINAASLCEKGYSQPLQVLPLPVWDDASTQIIHVNEFM